ncbi:MAG: glutamate--cysteine ligase [Rhodococcus sp. (in: high G+C Gram-positive bacteria)]|nr:glutamate--cysteine ligase [Rhodococcus sp. (in: high G+C Gram-positive bacteria)]
MIAVDTPDGQELTAVDDNDVPTIGVEEELLLVGGRSGEPAMANQTVAAHAQQLGLELQLELTPCQIETATPVLSTSAEISASLHNSRGLAAHAARMAGVSVLAAGVPPVLPRHGPITDTKRYRRIAAEYGVIASEQGVCGAHVHIAVPERDRAVQIGNYLRPWLPLLLALTANSALYGGRDTGYASWRSVLWSRWPSAGPPPFIDSFAHYQQLVEQLFDVGAILDDGMLYWDIRPSATFPTLEVRISDVPARVDDTVMLALLIRALVMTASRAVDAGIAAPPLPEHQLRWAYWRASRDGLSSSLVDPRSGRLTSARAAIDSMVHYVESALSAAGDRDEVARAIDRNFRDGNGAAVQRRLHDQSRSAADVVAQLARH